MKCDLREGMIKVHHALERNMTLTTIVEHLRFVQVASCSQILLCD